MSQEENKIEVRGQAPLFQVFDMPASLHFYRDILGFEFISGTPESENDQYDWVLLRMNGVEFMLNTAYESQDRPTAPDPARIAAHEDVTIYFGCPNVDETYELLISKGLKIEKPFITHYHFKTLAFRDPDGFNLVFHWPENSEE